MSYHQQMSFSKCMKLIMVSNDGTHVVGRLGKRLSSEVAGGECALLEGSATNCGHFPHHVPHGMTFSHISHQVSSRDSEMGGVSAPVQALWHSYGINFLRLASEESVHHRKSSLEERQMVLPEIR